MGKSTSAYIGCFLGLAVGDAMGYTVDELDWQTICENYGPNGLLGYDMQEEYAQVTSYTQIAAFVANGLLLGVTRGRRSEYLKFVEIALREWHKRQHFPRSPDKSWCWVAQKPELRRRCCRDAWMMDALRFEQLGTMERLINNSDAPGAILAAAAVALFFDMKRMEPEQVGELTAKIVAMTHGNPDAYLSAVVLAYALTGILHEPEQPLQEQFLQAAQVMAGQFGDKFVRAKGLAASVKAAVELAQQEDQDHRQNMENFQCSSASECLCAAMYASLVRSEDFDSAMILAVNHSGRSGAVGGITGAILGAKLGQEALPDFYLESLEPIETLRQLAQDLAVGSPATGFFDDAWDQKYTHGNPLS